MIKQLGLFGLFFFCVISGFSQLNTKTFSGSVGNIDATAGATEICFPLTVSGVGNIDSKVLGIESVGLDLTFPVDSILEIYLKSPNSTDSVSLSVRNNISSKKQANFTNTLFTNNSNNPIWTATPPFTGSFLPDGILGLINDGRNADGQWNLCIKVLKKNATIGTLNKWSITFSSSPAPYISVNRNSSVVPSGSCDNAPLICSFDGYMGTTSNTYAPPHIWQQLEDALYNSCQVGIQNNSFLKFVAGASTVKFDISIFNSRVNKQGIQMFIYDGGCGSGAVKIYGCEYTMDVGYKTPFRYTATGLTPGNSYYLMFDGSSADVCDYIVQPLSGSIKTTVQLDPITATVCKGNSLQMNATSSLSGNTFTWSPVTGLDKTSGSTVTLNSTALAAGDYSYTVSAQQPLGGCPATQTSKISVVEALAFTTNPSTAAPTYNVNQAATALTVVGNQSNLLYQWYLNSKSTNTGGTAISGANTASYTPATTIPGSYYYYCVISNKGCSLASDVSGNITVKAPNTCSSTDTLIFSQQPTDSIEQGASMAVAVKIICKQYGNVVTSYNGAVTLKAKDGCGFVDYTVNAVSGVANFPDVIFKRSVQTGVSLVATAAGVPDSTLSNTFKITTPTSGGGGGGGGTTTTALRDDDFSPSPKIKWAYATPVAVSVGSGGSGRDVTTIKHVGTNYYLNKSYSADNASSEKGTQTTITFNNTSGLSAYDTVAFSFQVASLNAAGNTNGNVGDGVDKNDDFFIEGSTDGGATWSTMLTIYGSSDYLFDFSSFSPFEIPSINSDLSFGYDAVSGTYNTQSSFYINLLPKKNSFDNFQFRITARDNRKGENWAFDNIKLTGVKGNKGIVVTPAPLPTVTAAGGTSICSGSAASLTSSVSNTVGTVKYQWTPSTVDAALATPNSDKTSASPTSPQTYSLSIVDADGCKATSEPVSVTLNVLPQIQAEYLPGQKVCVNGKVDSLTVGAINTESYQWYSNTVNSYTGANVKLLAGETKPTFTPSVGASNAGDSLFYFCTLGGSCNPVSSSISGAVVVHALPSVTAPSAVCIGKTVTLSPVTGGVWLSSAPTLATVTNAGIVAGVAAGSSTFTFTENINGCSATTTAITVNALPTINVVATENTVCVGVSSTLTASGADTYSWQGGPATASYLVSPGVTTVYTVTGTNTTTSCSNTGTITITTGASATASVAIAASPAGTICAGASVKFTATPTSGGSAPTYQWFKDGVAITGATNDNYSYTPADKDNITCKMVSNSACVVTKTVTSTAVTESVASIPNVVITNPATACSPLKVDITASAVTAGSTAGLTYTYWNELAATTSYTTPSAAGAGTYYIKGTSGAGCSAVKPVVVTVEALPTLSVTSPAAVCSPSKIDITSASITTGSTAGLTYTYWKDASATTTTYATPAAADAGTYYIKGITAAGCAAVKAVTVTVNALPNLSITNPLAVCSPSKVDITDATVTAGSASGLTYTYWKDALATAVYSTPTAATNGTYYIKGTTAAGCSTIKPVAVTVNAAPKAFTVTGGGNFCSGSTGFDVGLSSSEIGVDYQLQIDGSDFGTAISGTGSAISYSQQSTLGSYTVVATNSTTGCVANMTGSVSILKTSVLTLSINTTVSKNTICLGDNTLFTASALNAGTSPTYEWTVNGVTAQANTSNTFSSKSLRDKDTVKCILKSTADCLVKDTAISAPIVVTVNTAPVVPAIVLGGSNPICAGITTSLSNAYSSTPSTISSTWSSNNVSVATVDQTGLVTGVGNGSVNINYGVTNTCGTTTKSYVITVSPKTVVAAIAGDAIVCKDHTTQFTDATKGGVWSSSNPSVATVKDGLVSALTTGQSTISYTVSGSCVANVPALIVKVVGETPKVSFTPTPPTCLNPAIGSISVTDVKGSEGPYQCVYNGTPYAIPFSVGNLVEGMYSIDITNQYGCVVDNTTINNYLLGLSDDGNCDTLYVPTCYIPGHKNDYNQTQYFKPLGGSIVKVKAIDFKVYNRLGNLVFQTQNLYNGWNGTFNGIDQPTGTYVWYLTYTLVTGNGKPIERKGSFVLIR